MQTSRESAAATLFICLMVFAVVFVFFTAQYLPPRVATHFGADRRPDGWMSRGGYLVFMLVFTVGIASLVAFAIGSLPRRFPRWTNLPNRDYWLAAERREASLEFLSAHGNRLACLILLMMIGMHYTILAAHRVQPPIFPAALFTAIMIGFALALAWWLVRLYRRFPKPQERELCNSGRSF